MIPRGIRLNNPGNIEHGAPWEGLDPRNRDPRFCGFVSPEYGIRAIVRVLITYYDKRRARDGSRIDTVREIVERWAPAGENNTEAYAKHVASLINADPDMIVDVKNYSIMRGLVIGIIKHENGIQPYTDAQIDEGLRLAGIQPPAKPVVTVTKGATVTAGIAAAGAAIEQLSPALPLLQTALEYAPMVVVAAMLLGAAYFIYSQRAAR